MNAADDLGGMAHDEGHEGDARHRGHDGATGRAGPEPGQKPYRLDVPWFRSRVEESLALQQLRDRGAKWLGWVRVIKDDGKISKKPTRANGIGASHTTKAHWCTLEEMLEGVAAGRIDGGGIVLVADDEYTVIDLDHCLDMREQALPWAVPILMLFAGTYQEVSPSGFGVHIILKGRIPGKVAGRRRVQIECYSAKRFMTMSGKLLDGAVDEIVDQQEQLNEFWHQHLADDSAAGPGAKPNGSNGHAHDGTDEPYQDTGEGADDGEFGWVELPAMPPALDQVMFNALMANDPYRKFKPSWKHRRTDLADHSLSTYDLALATSCALSGWPPGQIWAVIIAHRRKYGAPDDIEKAFRRNYARLTIGKAIRAAEPIRQARAEAQARQQARQDEIHADPRPCLWTNPGNQPANMDLAARVLDAAPYEMAVFKRGVRAVVTDTLEQDQTRLARDDKTPVASVPKGSVVLQEARPEHITAKLLRLVKPVMRTTKGETVLDDIPDGLAKLVLAEKRFRPLKGVVRSPTLRADGSILTEPGYDPATQLILALVGEFPPVLKNPTLEEAWAAYKRLMHPFRGLPFDADVDRAVLAAEILTPITRHLYPRAPGFLHRAPEIGTGKTLAADVSAIISTSLPAANHAADVLNDPTELRKQLSTWTLTGVLVGLFDNAKRGSEIEVAELGRFLTAVEYGDRLLGKNSELLAPVCTTVVITGNGITVAGELRRRFLVVDLDPGSEQPDAREFDFSAEHEAVTQRQELVVAALTIVRAWILAGRPVPDFASTAYGSYEAWSKWVRWPIAWVSGVDPCDSREKLREADSEERAPLERLLTAILAAHGSGVFLAGRIIELCASTDEMGNDAHPVLAAVVAEVCAGSRKSSRGSAASDTNAPLSEAQRLGRYLKGHAGRIAGKLKLVREGTDGHSGTGLYRVATLR
jgi:hypothetical protein